MKSNKNIAFIGAIFMIFIYQVSCASHIPPYSTVIRNVGSKEFSHSKIIFGNRVFTVGWVTPGKHAINVNPNTQIPDKTIISWQREDGVVYEKEIELKGKLPRLENNQEYYLIFDIDDNENAIFKVVVCGKDENCLNKW